MSNSSQVVLYMAVSADGFIAGVNNETPWSDAEWEAYREFVKSCDVCLIGSRTYEVMKASDEFVDGAKYLVVTHDNSIDTGGFEKISIQSADDMPQVSRVGVIGGGELNGSLVALGVIDEIILDVEPVTIGQGKLLFGSHSPSLNLKLLSSKQIGDSTLQNHYEVLR